MAQQSLLGLQSLLVQLLRQQRNLSSQNNNEKNKVIIKQKNQSAQKNVNLFLLNTRVKTKKGKIPSFGFGVMETVLGILNDRHKCLNSNLNLNSEEKLV